MVCVVVISGSAFISWKTMKRLKFHFSDTEGEEIWHHHSVNYKKYRSLVHGTV